MTLYLYKISNDRRVMSKTLNVDTLLGSITAHIKGDTDIMNPVFEIAYSADYMDANYIYCPDWHRYYFIKEPPTVSQQRLILNCHEDVLMSHKSDIKELECMVERAEESSKTDLYMNDKAFKAEARKIVQTRKFPFKFPDSVSIVLTTGGPS